MNGIACDTCGGRLKVNITGGSFLVREYSTLDDINFEIAPDNRIITQDNSNTEPDTPLTVDVVCTVNPDHGIFDFTVSKIKESIYMRIMLSAQKYIQKYRE